MKLAMSIAALIIAALVLPIFFIPDSADMSKRLELLPWNIETRDDGHARVMGITLGQTPLEEARQLYGPDMDVAIVTAPDEPGAIEAYVASAKAGYITGKLVIVVDATPEMVAAMRERAKKTEYMESTTRKATPLPADLATIFSLPVRSLAFIPTINLDQDAIAERFGPAAERIQTNDHQTHLLYPEKGLDVILDTKGKELLQYVSPKDFAVLTAPLHARQETPEAAQ